jgi:hypothetical protein
MRPRFCSSTAFGNLSVSKRSNLNPEKLPFLCLAVLTLRTQFTQCELSGGQSSEARLHAVGLGADSTLSDAQFSALSGNIAVPKRPSDDVKYAKHLSPPIVAKDSSSRMAIMLYDDRHSFAYDHTSKLLFGRRLR